VFTPDEQNRLLQIARRALEARVRRTDAPAPEGRGVLDRPSGAFVSIHHRGALRGCLGRLEADMPLCQTVAHLGAVVADSDPRFDPVDASELAEIDIEISVLTPESEVSSIEEITIGRHGLIVTDGFRRGLLLPQVAVEHGWDRETFLDHASMKAGLRPDAWRRGARIEVFEALVFSEQRLPSREDGEA
jgi:uncharacterized protein